MLTLKKLVWHITCDLTLTYGKDSRFHLLFVSKVYYLMYVRCIMSTHVTFEMSMSLLVGFFVLHSIFRVHDQHKTWVNGPIVIF